MMQFLAQAAPEANFWNAPAGSSQLFLKIGLALAVGIGLTFALMGAPARARRPVVATFTFLAGLYWVAFFLWPQPIDRQPTEMPLDAVESVSFWLSDAQAPVSTIGQVLSSFLLGLGIYSLLRVHLRKIFKMQKDWFFSIVLMVSLVSMTAFGYMDWHAKLTNGALLENQANWGFVQYGRHFLFEGLLQQMDAAMFSIIAFFILSAAYRAFRIRSVEATILLATALIVMLSLMGAVTYMWDQNFIGDTTGPMENFKLSVISAWLRDTFQTPAIRGIDFGVGIGALAMGLRLWLSLERSGATG